LKHDGDMHIGYGAAGTMANTPDSIRFSRDGSSHFFGSVTVKKGKMSRAFEIGSLTCVNGGASVSTGDFGHRRRGFNINRGSWSVRSKCPDGYSTVGVGSVKQLDATSENYIYPMIDHTQCNKDGCRAYCRSTRCEIQARCCRGTSGPLVCGDESPFKGSLVSQKSNQFGIPSKCGKGFSALGFQRLEVSNLDYRWPKYVKEFNLESSAAKAFVVSGQRRSTTGGAVEARCCKPRVTGRSLKCISGSSAISPSMPKIDAANSGFGPYSACMAGYTAVGIEKLKLTRDSQISSKGGVVTHQNLRSYECNENGCRAWCDGSPCIVVSKCCKLA